MPPDRSDGLPEDAAELLRHDPHDGLRRTYTVRGYEDGREPSVATRYVYKAEPADAIRVLALAEAELPDLEWAIEWRRIDVF